VVEESRPESRNNVVEGSDLWGLGFWWLCKEESGGSSRSKLPIGVIGIGVVTSVERELLLYVDLGAVTEADRDKEFSKRAT
jgi:hypothetical protein